MLCVVAACPTNISQFEVNSHEFLVTWTPPNSENSSILGYQVFNESSNGSKQNMTISDMNADNATLTGLTPLEEYAVTVLSFGGEFVLPSVHCETITIVGKGCFVT